MFDLFTQIDGLILIWDRDAYRKWIGRNFDSHSRYWWVGHSWICRCNWDLISSCLAWCTAKGLSHAIVGYSSWKFALINCHFCLVWNRKGDVLDWRKDCHCLLIACNCHVKWTWFDNDGHCTSRSLASLDSWVSCSKSRAKGSSLCRSTTDLASIWIIADPCWERSRQHRYSRSLRSCYCHLLDRIQSTHCLAIVANSKRDGNWVDTDIDIPSCLLLSSTFGHTANTNLCTPITNLCRGSSDLFAITIPRETTRKVTVETGDGPVILRVNLDRINLCPCYKFIASIRYSKVSWCDSQFNKFWSFLSSLGCGNKDIITTFVIADPWDSLSLTVIASTVWQSRFINSDGSACCSRNLHICKAVPLYNRLFGIGNIKSNLTSICLNRIVKGRLDLLARSIRRSIGHNNRCFLLVCSGLEGCPSDLVAVASFEVGVGVVILLYLNMSDGVTTLHRDRKSWDSLPFCPDLIWDGRGITNDMDGQVPSWSVVPKVPVNSLNLDDIVARSK